jgi:hypothetical protein
LRAVTEPRSSAGSPARTTPATKGDRD